MASADATARNRRRPVLLAAFAILGFHAAVLLAIAALTRSPAADGSAPSAAGAPEDPPPASPVPSPWPVPADAPAGVPAAAFASPEVLSAPEVVQAEPVVPLPAAPEERAETLATVRQRRLLDMLEQRANRAAAEPGRVPAGARRR